MWVPKPTNTVTGEYGSKMCFAGQGPRWSSPDPHRPHVEIRESPGNVLGSVGGPRYQMDPRGLEVKMKSWQILLTEASAATS